MVYSTLDIFTTVVSTRGPVTHRVSWLWGLTTPPADILAASLVVVGYTDHSEDESICKNQEN